MRNCLFVCLVVSMLLASGCQTSTQTPARTPTRTPAETPTETAVARAAGDVEPFQDVRGDDLSGNTPLGRELMATLWFNENTVWPAEDRELALTILEQGMDPGLGVGQLHAEGITGEGVSVAIIDQNLCHDLGHPEYQGKIAEYHDVGTDQPADEGSMHGPAVASLLVGESIGTAPGATLYYVAAPSWTADARFYADALDWIVDLNEELPDNAKIRVVSVSAAPSGPGSPFDNGDAWDAAFERAAEAGILVLDCTSHRGITGPCYYDLSDPDDLAKCQPGWPGRESSVDLKSIYLPTSCRTQAEEYDSGDYAYQYTGRGGLSWSVPYLAGILALGWQIRPDLMSSELLDMVFATAYVAEGGAKVIDPPAFIEAVGKASAG